MTFPGYVPDAVRQYITRQLYGDGRSLAGWAALAKEPDHEWVVPAVAFMQRFEKKDKNIEETFSYLDKAEFSDADKKQFVNFAWVVLTDYKKYRAVLKRAEKQRQDIAKKAEELANLLRDISGHAMSGLPMEFYKVRTLLRATAGSDLLWPIMRWQLLADPGEKVAADLDYIWGIAPDLPELLDTVAKAARNYEPQFYGRIGAAVGKREGNIKTNYLRAFGHMLAEARIEPTPDVQNAVARMATVAINDAAIEVSSDDVRQALGLKGKGTGAAG